MPFKKVRKILKGSSLHETCEYLHWDGIGTWWIRNGGLPITKSCKRASFDVLIFWLRGSLLSKLPMSRSLAEAKVMNMST